MATMNVLDPRYADGPARRDGVGAVLAARRPFTYVTSARLRVTERTARTPWCGVVAAVVPFGPPFGEVLFVHHKPSWPFGWERERELQAVEAAGLAENVVRRRRVAHAVLLGDFDATPDSAGVRFWRGLQSLHGRSVCYEDAWPRAHPGERGDTFTPRNPLVRRGDMPEEAGRRIDYVMVRCTAHGPTLHVAWCDRLCVEPSGGVQVSDHYGLTADLTAPTHRPGAWAGDQ